MQDIFSILETEREKNDIVSAISEIPSNYIGSKRRMLVHIWDILENNEVKFDSVFDAFSGSAMVSLLFKKIGKNVYCNDLLTSSTITAICLLEDEGLPISFDDINFLCNNKPKNERTFVFDNYQNKFFTEKECRFLDQFRRNVDLLRENKFYCGLDVLNKAILASIPNSNFSIYGKNLKSLRSTHKIGESFWNEKWRDTTRKRRDENNEIMFQKSIEEMYLKYRDSFSLLQNKNHINWDSFSEARYYDGKSLTKIRNFISKNSVATDTKDIGHIFNSDIIELLESNLIKTDLIYLDPPYGGSSSDYAILYRFLEEYLYEDKLENLEHIKKGSKRFSQKKGYQEQFEKLLSLCSGFKTWLISYNDSSYETLDVITSTIKNAGKKSIIVSPIPLTYKYRKGGNKIDMNNLNFNYFDDNNKCRKGTEYLILAQ